MQRSDRERDAYDTHDNLQGRPWVHRVFSHIFAGPNARYGEELFFNTVAERIQDKTALELGCGSGGVAARLAQQTNATILATDISPRQIDQTASLAISGRLEFRELNAEDAIDDSYDVIYGRGVLHHIDFRQALERLANDNLRAGGAMVFREPLGANVLGAAYRLFSKDDHTDDERPVTRADLSWFKETFKGFWYYPYGLASLPLGAMSSPVFKNPDNPLTRLGHRLDHRALRHVALVRPWFRAAVLVIDPA
jgi:SAM-dependent methyltransferase